MSVKVMGWIWDLELEPATKFVFLALGDHADHAGDNAHPSVELLAAKTGYSERQVQRVLSELRDRGLIEPDSLKVGRGQHITYRIVMRKDDSLAPIPTDKGRQPVTHLNTVKGDGVAPIDGQKDDDLSPIQNQKGDNGDTERVTSTTQKGDIRDSTLKGVNRPINHPVEPSGVNSPLPPSLDEIPLLPDPPGSAPLDDDAIREKRHAVFAAYATGVGILPDTGEWIKRWNLSWGELSPAVLKVMTPERMRDLAAFVSRRRRADGIRHVPSVDLVILAESEFGQWDAAGRPEVWPIPEPRRTSLQPSGARTGNGSAVDYFTAVARGESQ